jgi:hypothetical protein
MLSGAVHLMGLGHACVNCMKDQSNSDCVSTLRDSMDMNFHNEGECTSHIAVRHVRGVNKKHSCPHTHPGYIYVRNTDMHTSDFLHNTS